MQVELYSSLVERHFKSDMVLQTWLRGGGAMPSFCPPLRSYVSLNVRVLEAKFCRLNGALRVHSEATVT